MDDAAVPPKLTPARAAGLIAGPAAFAILAAVHPDSLGRDGAMVLGIAAWMGVWWITEAIPLGATSLLPLALFPLLGVSSMRDAAAPYAHDLVFLFLAGFFIAAALQHWRAHARIAYGIVGAVGGGSRRVVFGVMLATAAISMWISNTATAAMMYPIALAIAEMADDSVSGRNLRTALMLGVAYAASIGGMSTLIGTPPNLLFAGAAAELTGTRVGFTQFMAIGVPAALVLLPGCWLLLSLLFPSRDALREGAHAAVAARRAELGRLAGGERLTMIVFMATALAWLLRERKEIAGVVIPGLADIAPGLTDSGIGVAGALLLFVIWGRGRDGARRPLLTWREARAIPWEVLLVYGGGFSLATAMDSSGLARWLGSLMAGLGGLPDLVVFGGLALLVLLLSEVASNTATAAMALPIAASLGYAIGEPPIALMLVTALAASAGFALPVATPPNLIVFGSGHVTVRQMARAGVLLDLMAVAVVVLLVMLLHPVVFGAD
jgi:solute carrier family 13 (sodium-dependent dicarboxylate transporter), member 2/3/5